MPTPTPPDPVETVERFAELSALLDDPFADQPAILAAAGLAAPAWRAIEGRWMAQLAAVPGEALAERFGKIYATTRQSLSRAPDDGAQTASLDVRCLLPPMPFVAGPVTGLPPPSPPPPHDPSGTLEAPVVLPMPPVLPFSKP